MSDTRSVVNRRALGLAVGGGLAVASALPAAARQATPAAEGDDWAEVTGAIEAVAPQVAYLASEIVDATYQPISALNADREQAVGSSFKLYILATIGEQVAAGERAWSDPVEIQEDWLSVPHGDMRYVAPGTRFTLRYIAEKMIQNSDNTATDHAIYTVGRENVEAMFATAGQANPERNIPLLTTREFAMMKFLYPDIDRYLAADVEERREILATEIDTMSYQQLLEDSDEQTAPLHIETVEWFLSPTDLTNVMIELKRMGESDFGLQPLLEIMTLETQLVFDASIWPYVGFKGGSEMGVLAGTWLMRRHDDRWFVFSIGFNNPDAPLDQAAAVGAIAEAIDLLAVAP